MLISRCPASSEPPWTHSGCGRSSCSPYLRRPSPSSSRYSGTLQWTTFPRQRSSRGSPAAGSESPPPSGSGPSPTPGPGWRGPGRWELQPPQKSSSAGAADSALTWVFSCRRLLEGSPPQGWLLCRPSCSEPLERCHSPGFQLQEDRVGLGSPAFTIHLQFCSFLTPGVD